MKATWAVAWTIGVAAIAAAAVQFFSFPPPAAIPRNVPLTDYLPVQMAGWHGEDMALGGTEAISEEVEKILQYDEFVNRTYRKGNVEFNVYIAYWKPGKMPSREIAFHIPDKCWPTAGWKRQDATYDYCLKTSDLALGPGQLRTFAQSGSLQHVLYWHIFSGQILVYNRDGSPSDLSVFTDLFRLGLRLKGEQYFIRVSSSQPLEKLYQDDGFHQILELVAPLGPGSNLQVTEFDS